MTSKVTFVGCGDAFGSGGRFNTCFLFETPGVKVAIDCGASSLIALKKLGIDPNTIDVVVLTHFHGDHCGGVPFLLLDAALGARRRSPLTIIGPRDTRARITALSEALFPTMHKRAPQFDLTYLNSGFERPLETGSLKVTSFPAAHTDATIPSSVRVEAHGKVVAYTGDSAWTEHMPALAKDADLFICESYFYDTPIRFHLNHVDILEHRSKLAPKRMVLTHLSPEMLEHAGDASEQCAYDGLTIAL
jgi:ribonuclease BN (tRNA processing enzyme)